MRLLSPRYTCYCYCLVFMLVLLLHTEICSISTTSMSDSYYNNTTLWHNLYRHKSIDCRNLYWLHPAKTSSSFIIPLQHVCCPELFENITSDITVEMLEDSYSRKVEGVDVDGDDDYGGGDDYDYGGGGYDVNDDDVNDDDSDDSDRDDDDDHDDDDDNDDDDDDDDDDDVYIYHVAAVILSSLLSL